MHAHSLMGLQTYYSPGVCGQRYKNEHQDLYEDPENRLKKWINCICLVGGTTLLQHDNAKPHTNVTSVALETISFEFVPHPL